MSLNTNLVDEKNRKDQSPENPGPVLDPTYQLVRESKSPEAAALRRAHQFTTVEQFAAWRRSKGFPELDQWNLLWAWAEYMKCAPSVQPGVERAVATPVVERR